MRARAFSSGQIATAASLACAVQGSLVALMAAAHGSGAFVPRPEPKPMEMVVAVNPMLDLPLLKKGTPRPAKARRAPKPPPPEPVEPVAVPTPLAPKVPDPEPKPEVDKKKQQVLKPPAPDKPPPTSKPSPPIRPSKEYSDEPEVAETEGAAEGAEEGTETDPLKARALDLYRLKLISWFKQGFSPPPELECGVLLTLQAAVTARIGPDGVVTGYSMVPSGNALFDQRVRRVMDGRVGQAVPPPPPNYPELLETTMHPTFHGKTDKCK